MHIGFWWPARRNETSSEDQVVGGWIILKWIIGRWDGDVGWMNWLRIGTSGGHL
jgi:hypothetical protein